MIGEARPSSVKEFKFNIFHTAITAAAFQSAVSSRGVNRHPACSGLPKVKIGRFKAGRNPFVSRTYGFRSRGPQAALGTDSDGAYMALFGLVFKAFLGNWGRIDVGYK